jgi:uncharacterized protein (UPF0333 family)
MSNKPQIAMSYSVLLVIALLAVSCDVARVFEQASGCYKVGAIEWCKTSGNVERDIVKCCGLELHWRRIPIGQG